MSADVHGGKGADFVLGQGDVYLVGLDPGDSPDRDGDLSSVPRGARASRTKCVMCSSASTTKPSTSPSEWPSAERTTLAPSRPASSPELPGC